MDQTDQITRQTGFVQDVQTNEIPACAQSFPQPVRNNEEGQTNFQATIET